MDVHHPATEARSPVLITIVGNQKLQKAFGNDKLFKAALETLLEECGFSGGFTVNMGTRIKGTGFSHGLQLGAPNIHRRSVEVKWQSGGNETRFSLQLQAPNGMEAIDFHAQLDKVLQARPPKDVTPDEGIDHTDRSVSLTDTDIELFFGEIVASATDAGMVMRQKCVEVLTDLGRAEPDVDLDVLLTFGRLQPGKTNAFLRIPEESLKVLRAERDPDSLPVLSPNQSESTPPEASPPPSSFLETVERYKKLVEELTSWREKKPVLTEEEDRLVKLINESTSRLTEVRAEIQQAEAFLGNPEAAKAEETLASLRTLLGD